jgi:glutaredoxin 3
VLLHPGRRAEMTAKAGGRTSIPQIFIDGRAIGGSDELAALDASGELDTLLASG